MEIINTKFVISAEKTIYNGVSVVKVSTNKYYFTGKPDELKFIGHNAKQWARAIRKVYKS